MNAIYMPSLADERLNNMSVDSPIRVPGIPMGNLSDSSRAIESRQACHALPILNALVYVVDSYVGLADVAKTILEAEGFRTSAFDNRIKAWQAFAYASQRPMVLIADDLNGAATAMDFIRRCRQAEPALKTVCVTLRRSYCFKREDRELVDAWLSRPYCGPLLVQEVRRLCSVETDTGRIYLTSTDVRKI